MSYKVRSNVIQRGDVYDEGDRSVFKNPWRWEWCSNTVRNKRAGKWIQKINIKGKALCLLCDTVIMYGNKGFCAIRRHLECPLHTDKEDLDT